MGFFDEFDDDDEASWATSPDPALLGLTWRQHTTWNPQGDNLQAPPSAISNGRVFLAMDIEIDCTAEEGLCEIGIATLDTRRVENIAPGDRCSNWFPHIQSTHIRNLDHFHDVHRDNHSAICRHHLAKGDRFAFGHTLYMHTADISHYLQQMVEDLRRTNGGEREIVLVVWSSSLEESTIKELGLDWLDTFHSLYDFQRFAQANALRQHWSQDGPISLRDMASALGLSFRSPRYGSLLHNGGNDATIELHAFLASLALTTTQFDEIRVRGAPREHLSRVWSEDNIEHNRTTSNEEYNKLPIAQRSRAAATSHQEASQHVAEYDPVNKVWW
ncbi:Hypothetical protein D9617_1g088110 [Elsinoe fawcettii]|nr:Hypothetical protein D9617_1g088110 [Elsinoe fawcettii]